MAAESSEYPVGHWRTVNGFVAQSCGSAAAMFVDACEPTA